MKFNTTAFLEFSVPVIDTISSSLTGSSKNKFKF